MSQTKTKTKRLSKKQKFLKEVMHEINMLKQHATQEEISRLDFRWFSPDSTRNCIYGQMTGDCTSLRAKELMDLSCIRLIINKRDGTLRGSAITSNKFTLNGKYKSTLTWDDEGRGEGDNNRRLLSHLSALEGYIFTKNANVEGIMNYLRGKSEIVKL